MSDKPGVTGLGGIFFKSRDPKALRTWYAEHLGLQPMADHGHNFRWREPDSDQDALTVWSPFAADTKYFEPSKQPFMVNFRVRKLDELLEQLRAAGVEVDDEIEDFDYGRFAWVMDPEGNRIELWEPTDELPVSDDD